jgi:small subunit ribosomal protein S8
MSVVDPVGDLITRIRNAQMAFKETVDSPCSRLRLGVLEVLLSEGYIRGYFLLSDAERLGKGFGAVVQVELKYYEGRPVIETIKRVSTPGRRVYSSVKSLPLVKNGLGINVLSTDKGILSDVSARRLSVGGEVLCSVF